MTTHRIEEPTDVDPDSPTGVIFQQIVDSGMGEEGRASLLFRTMGKRPEFLDAAWTLTRQLLFEGQLPPIVTQLVMIGIAMKNGCRYCTVTHGRVLERMGVSEELIRACVNDPTGAGIPDKHREILRFALAAARDPNALTDSDFDRLRAHGLTDEELIEIIFLAGFSELINIWADATATPIDP